MKEIEEEQKKWEEKINSSKSSFSINSSIKDDKKKNDYKINVYEFNNLDEKNKKHIIREKKLVNDRVSMNKLKVKELEEKYDNLYKKVINLEVNLENDKSNYLLDNELYTIDENNTNIIYDKNNKNNKKTEGKRIRRKINKRRG